MKIIFNPLQRRFLKIGIFFKLLGIITFVLVISCKKNVVGPILNSCNEVIYPFNVSDTYTYSRDPHIAIDKYGVVHIVWIDGGATGYATSYIYHRTFDPSDEAWSVADTISDTRGYCLSNAIAADIFGNVHIIWEASVSGHDRVYYRELYTNGEWSNVVELSRGDDARYPLIVSDSLGGVHAVWHSSYGWIYKYKGPAGTWITKDTLIFPDINVSAYLYAKVDGDLVLILSPWYGILYYEHPFGGIWSSGERVDTGGMNIYSWYGYYGYDRENNKEYVFWTGQTNACDSSSGEIFYRCREEGQWSNINKVDGTCGWPRFKNIFVLRDDIEVVYYDEMYKSIYDLYKSHKDNRWVVDTFVDEEDACDFFLVDCVIDREEKLHCVWTVMDKRGISNIFYDRKEFGRVIR